MYAHKHPEPTDPRVGPAIVYLIVGLPGAGKTAHAKELEISASVLRLTRDEWQVALFGDQDPPEKRDLVEGKLVQLGMRAAEVGTHVVFDFGFWGKDERSALRHVPHLRRAGPGGLHRGSQGTLGAGLAHDLIQESILAMAPIAS